MRLLLDQCTPLGLVKLLTGHEVVRAAQLGWSELVNGALIAAAEAAGFDVLVTTDKQWRYQQNLIARRIAIVVLSTNRWHDLRDRHACIADAIARAAPGSYEDVEFPRPTLVRRPPPRFR